MKNELELKVHLYKCMLIYFDGFESVYECVYACSGKVLHIGKEGKLLEKNVNSLRLLACTILSVNRTVCNES